MSRDNPELQLLPLTYEAHLPRFNANVLKRLARLWIGPEASKLSKTDCVEGIIKALAEPETVRQVVAGLSEFEQAALGLLKFHGQTAPTRTFAMQLLMLGLPFAERSAGSSYRSYDGDSYAGLNLLLNKGLLVLRDWQSSSGYSSQPEISDYHYRPEVFTDLRILSQVEPAAPVALELAPVTGLGPGQAKHPGEAVLRLISLAEALRKIGRIDLTRKGRPAKPFLTKLTKTLGWGDLQATDTPLPDPPLFFFKLFEGAGFIQHQPGDTLGLNPNLTKTFESPYEAQASRWVQAYSGLTGWVEYVPASVYLSDDELLRTNKFNDCRAALLMGLAALPDASGWYRIRDLSEAIYQRIGERFSLGYVHPFYAFSHTQNAEEQRQKWRNQVHTNWRKAEQPWIAQAVTGPLFQLGLIELVELTAATSPKKSDAWCFRLTELGRAVLYDQLRSVQGGQREVRTVRFPAPDGSCWIVQPNFDVIAFLDRASPARLAFLERIAERKPSEGVTALYHLTRETVYAGLESGIEASTLVETLSQGCDYPLPDNIRQTLTDWAERREQLSVYRASSVLEFPDQLSRDAQLAKKQSVGTPIGDRFLVLHGQQRMKSLSVLVSQTLDYYGPPSRCLKATEDGRLTLDQTRADFLVRGELSSWAEPAADNSLQWQVTRGSIQRAIRTGWTADRVIDSLSQRLQNKLPPLLEVAIRAWAKPRTQFTTVGVATDLILQIADRQVAHAIGGSPLLKPYLRSRLGPQTFVVDRQLLKELRKKLEGLGLEIGSDLTLEAFRYLTGKEK